MLARKAGVGFDYFENYRTKHAQDLAPLPAEVALVLDGARSVRIKAVDSSGQPVSGITFTALVRRQAGQARIRQYRRLDHGSRDHGRRWRGHLRLAPDPGQRGCSLPHP